MLVDLERWLRSAGVVAGLVTLAYMLVQGVWRGLRRPSGRATVRIGWALRPSLLLFVGALWIGLCVFLWRPVPLSLSAHVQVAAYLVGAALYFAGLGLYWWGALSLGALYRPSSALGVQLDAHHRLVTDGPYAHVRHPLYVGLQAAAIGGLLLYRTWTLVFVAINFVGLFARARREDHALAAEFGQAWESYRQRVPAWLPRLRRR